MTRIIVCGACGRMGSKILEIALGNEDFEIAGAIESEDHPSIGKKILDGKVPVGSDLKALQGPSTALIDFTSPKAAIANLRAVSSWKEISAVVGTTGFTGEELSKIKEISKKMPVVLSPNMSRGVNVMLDVARQIARKLAGYDIEIIESHHNQKKDAPSGTALALAEEIADELNRNGKTDFTYGRKGITGPRSAKEIGIHAVRAGDIVGEHTVLFASGGERLELVHRASSRDAFANGALYAAKWAQGKPAGLYSMKDVMRG